MADIPLIRLTTVHCNGKHLNCGAIAEQCINSVHKLDKTYIDKYIKYITRDSHYSNCFIANPKVNEIKRFILALSKKHEFIIIHLSIILNHLSDDECLELINNQNALKNTFINFILNSNSFGNGYSNSNIINHLLSSTSPKPKTITFLLNNCGIADFTRIFGNLRYSNNAVKYVIEYVKKNINLICNSSLFDSLLSYFINYVDIIKLLYVNTTIEDNKQKVIKFTLENHNIKLILYFLENNTIKPTIETLNKLLVKVLVRNGPSISNKVIAEIIDIFVDYGFKITKEIVLLLLDRGCYVNNIEKHNIEIDQDIIDFSSSKSYYPYKFHIKPELKVLIKECSKENNLEIIKMLKERGGEFNEQCLESACKIYKNGKVIKYLIKDCKIQPNNACLKAYEDAYKLETLTLLMGSYKNKDFDEDDNPITDNEDNNKENIKEIVPDNNKKIIELKKNSKIELNKDCIMSIIPNSNIELIEDKEYKLKNKIKNLLDYKKKNILIIDLFELFLKYLITNNLIIGNYLVINKELSELLKLNYCTIISVDEIHNMISYFIE
jgi:hypothetical protein